jgi:acyl-[acyl-carrier-protein]-phospholipid O-acyltransferase / long-chain-fatty-acid--[acyl-carrier-protein] ligase
MLLRLILKGLLRPLFRIVFRVRVHGNANVKAERLLIVANHESFLDELLLGLFLPQKPVVVVYTTATCNRLFRFFALGLVDYEAIDPNNPMELKGVIRLIESGRPVLIFPEGRVTTTGNLMKTYDGPGFIAAKSGATILPVRIEGAARSRFSLLGRHAPRTWLPRIRLFVLPATRITPPAAAHGEQHYLAGQAMHRVMTDLMFAGRPEQTLPEALVEAARRRGRNWRLLGDVEHSDYSYNDILRSAWVLGRKLAQRSREHEAIGLLLPNVGAPLALIFGLAAWRRVPALLPYNACASSLQGACEAAGIRTVISSREFVAQFKLQDSIAALQGLEILWLEDLRDSINAADRLWWLAWARFALLRACPRSQAEDPALVMFTAGSAEKPKGVLLSHRALLANVSQMRAVLDISSNDVVLNALPLHHSFGLTAGALIPLLSGAKVFLYPSPQHHRVVPELAYNTSATILCGNNSFLANYGRHAHPYDFSRLRCVIAGGEKITAAVRELWFEKFGARIFEGYGATEAACAIALNNPMASRWGSVGPLLPGILHRLQPLAGLPENAGVLHVAGPNLMSGYLRRSAPGQLAAPESCFGAGWLDTGDAVAFDKDGFLHLLGRAKQLVDSPTGQVSLGLIEVIAHQASPAHDHAAIVNAAGEIVLLTTASLDPQALASAASALGWPAHPLPAHIEQRPALPMLAARKPDYAALGGANS